MSNDCPPTRPNPAARTDREVIDETEARITRVETKLSRLLEATGLGFDGRRVQPTPPTAVNRPPTPPRAYVATLPIDFDTRS